MFDLQKRNFSTTNVFNVPTLKFVAYVNKFIGTLPGAVTKKNNNNV